MKKLLLTLAAIAMATVALQAKTLVAFYSFTNNCRTIAGEVKKQLPDADVVEVQPAEEGLDYAANNYALGSSLISAIRNAPNDASSYPAIKDVAVNFSQYSDVIIVSPLWWSNMAAPMQTFLFQNGSKLAGMKVGLIVSSASSGITSVVADGKRLIPQGNFTESLWILSYQTSACQSLVSAWLEKTGIGATTGIADINGNGAHTSVTVMDDNLVVNGDFKSVDIFDTTGRKLLSTTSRVTSVNKLNAADVYVAVVRGEKAAYSYKFSTK